MSAKQHHADLATFDILESLDDQQPWVLALHAIANHLMWTPKDLNGVSKAEFIRRVVTITVEKLSAEISESELKALAKQGLGFFVPLLCVKDHAQHDE